MSHYSGFSSASRLEIERLNQVNAQMAIKNAAEMAAQKAQLVAQEARLASMQEMLVANGLLQLGREHEPVQGTSAQALARDRAQARPLFCPPKTLPCSQPITSNEVNSLTPSRKRHSSQQLERAAKVAGGITRNRFEILSQANSYQDRTMKPGSVVSTPRAQAMTPAPVPGLAIAANQKPRSDGDASLNNQIKGVFALNNDRAMREEIEVALESMNGNPFRGTITPQEAKHVIFKQCLGLDLSIFDGARVGYKGMPVILFKLKSPINVDELFDSQHFDFRRKSSRQGRTHTDIISCKIRGLRNVNKDVQNQDDGAEVSNIDDGTRIIKIEGCDYRIPEDTLVEFLEFFGELKSEILEDLFDDGGVPDSESFGTNRTGRYSVKIKLNKDIPQLLPIMGKRIKIHYKGIQRLCPNCFGPHPKQVCRSPKVQWLDYASKFKSTYKNIPDHLFARWNEIKPKNPPTMQNESNSEIATAIWVSKSVPCTPARMDASEAEAEFMSSLPVATALENNECVIVSSDGTQAPTKKEFMIPLNKTEHEDVIRKLVLGGSSISEAELVIASRKTAFNKANKEFKKNHNSSGAANPRKPKTFRKLSNQPDVEYGS